MTFEIKKGRYYVNRLGEIHGPMRRATNDDGFISHYEFVDENGDAYTKYGKFDIYDEINDEDLIAEWTDPAEEPEWGEWECHSKALEEKINHGCDYMYRRIGNKESYCFRKPRTVTMLVDVIDGKPDLSTLRPVTE